MTNTSGTAATDPAFEALPDTARLWVFGTDRPLAPEEESRLLQEVDDFLGGWRAHGHPLSAGRSWVLGRFLMVAVDEGVEAPSGCSIDALLRRLRELEEALGLEMVGGGPVFFRAPGDEGAQVVKRVSRSEFRAGAQRGEIDGDTPVFDPTLSRLGEVRRGDFQRPAAESWHRAFLPSDPAGSAD
ncbi:MAG: hypothetical protein EA352_09445 [Gemmatimonadales bacterium]|nr:MAG: hypothetical protein EA352_09445 [Gemmatimonadales bacterium]